MRMFQVCVCGQPLQCNEQPTPEPKGTEVLLKVLAAGVCHSDLHIADGYFDMGGGKKLNLQDRGMKLPLTLGHENVGEVVAVGPDAKLGDGRQGRGPAAGGSVDRLRHLRHVRARRRLSLPQHEEPRRVLQRRLCRLSDGAASALSVRHRRLPRNAPRRSPVPASPPTAP